MPAADALRVIAAFAVTTVLAIDQGTSGTKALVVDGDGSVLAQEEVPVHPVALDDAHGAGGVEQDPEELWDSVLTAGHRALEGARTTVDAVALSNQGETVLPWDRTTGAPLAPALVWQDRRGRSAVRPARGRRVGRAPGDDHRARARSLLRRAQDRLDPRARHHRRRGHDD